MSYEVVSAPTARRGMSAVPERVIPAIIEFDCGGFAVNPRRVGKSLEAKSPAPSILGETAIESCTKFMTTITGCQFFELRIARTFSGRRDKA